MATAEGTFSEPVLDGVELRLTSQEAYDLALFLGKTNLGLVEDNLPYSTKARHAEVNEVLYRVYEALNGVVKLDWSE